MLFQKKFPESLYAPPMKKHLKIALLMLMFPAILLFSCKGKNFPSGEDLTIEWELISNQYAERPAVKARFLVTNNSPVTLSDDNWILYYNQSPRGVLGTHEASKTRV